MERLNIFLLWKKKKLLPLPASLEEDRFGPTTQIKKRDFFHNVSLLGFHKKKKRKKNFGKK